MPSHFDQAAKQYDAQFTFTQIGRAQRNRVYTFLNSKVLNHKPLHILELNCGTGEDALFFAEMGHKVMATDISEAMIKTAKTKANGKDVIFKKLDITKINLEVFPEKFDLIFSNFGGFNCLSPSQLESFITFSQKLLKDKGKLVLVIMSKNCLWERVYFLLKRQFKTAFRRNTKTSVKANANGLKVPTWYYNPKDIVTLTKSNYKTIAIKPVGISIPPSYLEPFFFNKQFFLNLFIKMEGLFSSRFWAKYADHYLIAFQKK